MYPKLLSAPLMSQESFSTEAIRKYHQDITDLTNKYHEKQRKYENTYNKLQHASTGASSVGVISGISTTGATFTVVGISINASLGVVSTVLTCVSGILLLTSKKYKKKLLKCCELMDKITSSLATFEVLISLSLNDASVIDAEECHKLQALHFQVMADVRNVDRKMKVQTGENFFKTILDEIKNPKNVMEQKYLLLVFTCYLIAYIIKIMKSKFKQIYYFNDGYWRGKLQYKNHLKHQVQQKKRQKNG